MGLDMYLTKQAEEDVGYWRKANHIHSWLVKNIQNRVDDCGTYEFPKEKMTELLNICRIVLAASELVEGKIANGQTYENDKWVNIMVDGKFIKNPAVAKKLLPTTEGFFFGSQDYDEYYYNDIVLTIEILTTALTEGGDYYYHSSW